MNLSDITKINFGSNNISAVYNGGIKLWPSGSEASNKVMKFTTTDGNTWDTVMSAYTADNRLITPVKKDATGWTYDEEVEYFSCSNGSSTNLLTFEGFPKAVKIKNANGLFQGCNSCTDISTANMDTSECWNMYNMFNGCKSLTSLDVSHFNTTRVTILAYMFSGCNSLTSLDVSHFNTSKAIDMTLMFNGCSKLSTLNVSNFDTSKVAEMESMFGWCKSLTSLDVSHFNTSNVTIMSAMFQNCSSLTSLDLSNWDTTKVTDTEYMFLACDNLKTVKMTNCSQATVDKIRAAVEAAGYLNNVNFVVDDGITLD